MCGIYVITNNINNKKYIGKSCNLNRRLRHHQVDTFNPNSMEYNTVIHKAIRKYGVSNFSFEILEECKEEDLDSREIYWIKKYKTYGKGYNMTYGGEGKSKIDKSEVFNLWAKGLSVSAIAKQMGHSKSSIIRILENDSTYSREESVKRGYLTSSIVNGDRISQYSLNGEIISTYDSIAEASRITDVPRHIIYTSLKDHKVNPNGFIWEYEDKEFNLGIYTMIKTNIKNPVEQLDLEGNHISYYNSTLEAARAMNTKYVQAIKVACKDSTKTAYGYKWRYVEGDKNAH